jgi:hypothetical protein
MQTVLEERQTGPQIVPKPRRRGWLIAVIALLVAVTAGAVLYAREWPFTRQAVVHSLEQQSGSPVEIAAFHRFYFPHVGCVAEGVTFRKDQHTLALITIQKLTIVGSYSGLLAHHLTTVRAEGFHLTARREAAAPESWENLGRTTSGLTIGKVVADGAEVEFPSEQRNQAPLVFRIPKLVVHDIGDQQPLKFKLTVLLPKPYAQVTIVGRFGPWQIHQAGKTGLSGSYSVRDLDLGDFRGMAGKLSASGEFDGQLGAVKTQGTIDAPGFEVQQSKHPVHLAALYSATVNGLNGDVSIDAARAHFRKTTILGTGTVQGEGPGKGKTASVQLSSRQARIEDLLWMFVADNPPAMTGPIVFRAKVRLPPENRAFLRKLQLQGDFGVSGAQYPNPETQKNIDVLSARARGDADKVEDINDKLGNDSYDPGRVVSNLKGNVALSDAVAHLRDVAFDVPGADAQVSGTYNLQTTQVDLSGHMHMVAELSKTTTGVKSFLLKAIGPFLHKSKRKESVVAIKIGGTYDHPTYAVVPIAEK